MAYLEELLPEFRKGAKIRRKTWNKNEFIFIKKDILFNEENWELDGTEMDIWDTFIASDWELYQDPEPDWQYIIKNKCHCWFYNGEDDEIIINTLNDILIDARNNMLFFDGLGKKWKNCRPVRRDEVTFYEDRKDD